MPQTLTRSTRQQSTLPFRDFLNYFHGKWEQGEHVTLIGPTGVGKTTLTQRLLTRRGFVTVFATKDTDSTMDALVRAGYKKQREWDGSFHDYIVLWPKGKTPEETMYLQHHEFNRSINLMMKQGGWAINFDEVSYLSDFLGMSRKLKWALQQSRSGGNSVIASTQRPAFIPLAFYDQASWLIFWNDNDDTNLKRIQGIGGVDGKVIRAEVQNLGHREILCVHNRYPYERVRTTVRI
jgi:hypothetical protein